MISLLLKMMFEHERWEQLLEKSAEKGINKADIRALCNPDIMAELYRWIRDNKLEFEPAHEAAIPKDEPGEFRIVYVGTPLERILCSLINDCLFELFPEMVHSACKSYQKGLSCGKTVQELSKKISKKTSKIVGAKYDFHHYFDTVNKESIMALFDKIENKLGFERGTEPVVNLLRRTWNNDWMFDLDKNLIQKWSGIRQGNAIGSWLADAVLYELDDYMSNHYEYYVRYSDDLIVLGEDIDKITSDINSIVVKYGVSLNPKKVETLYNDRWFRFLGFSIKGDKISISRRRLKTFQQEIMKRTIKQKHISLEKAVNSVNRYLYKGNGEYAWAQQILSIINTQEDLDVMNCYVMDCLRAVQTGKKKLGGLGYVPTNPTVVVRNPGRNVSSNMKKTEKEIKGYYSLGTMRDALVTNKNSYNTLVMQM